MNDKRKVLNNMNTFTILVKIMNEILKIIKDYNDNGELINIPELNRVMKRNVESEVNELIANKKINNDDVFEDDIKYLFVRN